MAAPHIPPPPPITRRVTDESEPKNDSIRVGIEIEGVGTVSTRWDQPDVVTQDNFHDVFKRTPLVRSNSFSGSAVFISHRRTRTRSVQAVPRSWSLRLTRSAAPACFICATRYGRRFAVPMHRRTGSAVFSDPRAPDPGGPVAETRWGRARLSKVSGSLQTTIGVATAKLFADSAPTRKSVVDLLVGKPLKAQKVIDMCKAAVVADNT